jgi:putative protease
MELLAPAGNLDNFYAAMEAGADAVYVGAPGINARNLSRDLSFAEIGAMIDYAHEHGKKVYIAANSLILESDLASLVKNLAILDALKPDALIVQDIGLVRVIRHNFPGLSLHASTLMGACNSQSVNFLGEQGCNRVVLARELTLKEIVDIASRVNTELEVFVHGAMCYSFSGLCLFSSYLGGKSGLRGRCVQPCRRAYTWQGQGGKKKQHRGGRQNLGGGNYVFSMNDLAGFEALAAMKDAGVASAKIEGRLRSANYVSKIVAAYRLVLDAEHANRESAFQEAEKLSIEALARKTSPGYFFSPQPQEAITPYHSGNMGLLLGSCTGINSTQEKSYIKLQLKDKLFTGDRLRLHLHTTGERYPFTLHRMQMGQHDVECGVPGDTVQIEIPGDKIRAGVGKIDVYKQDVRENPEGRKILAARVELFENTLGPLEKKITSRVRLVQQRLEIISSTKKNKADTVRTTPQQVKKGGGKGRNLDIWLKTDSAKLVTRKLPFVPDYLLLTMNKKMLSQSAGIKKYLGKRSRNVVWALPPVIFEREIVTYQKQIEQLVRSGYRSFQLGHFSQKILFSDNRVRLFGDYTLNTANSQALSMLAQNGFEGAQLAIELDRTAMSALMKKYLTLGRETNKGRSKEQSRRLRLGFTVYGAPPLFTSRLSGSHFQFNKTVVSPKGEQYILKKRDGLILTIPAQPFSLLPYLQELQYIGLDYIVIDTTLMQAGDKEMNMLAERLRGPGKYKKLPTFNYLGMLQ